MSDSFDFGSASMIESVSSLPIPYLKCIEISEWHMHTRRQTLHADQAGRGNRFWACACERLGALVFREKKVSTIVPMLLPGSRDKEAPGSRVQSGA